MNDVQKAAVQEEIAETQAAIDNLTQLVADDNLAIIQAKKSLSLHNGALAQQQAKLVALNEGL
jgi:hypothetical protein